MKTKMHFMLPSAWLANRYKLQFTDVCKVNFIKKFINSLQNTCAGVFNIKVISITGWYRINTLHKKKKIWSHLLNKSLMKNFVFGGVKSAQYGKPD